MKTMYKLLLSFVAIAVFALFISCEGPEGPVGPAGTDGTNGTNGVDGTNGVNGTDGTDGVDGNVSCLECHTQIKMDAIDSEYALSGHSAGNYVAYTSGAGRASCARCHNSEGFLYFLEAVPNSDGTAPAAATDIYNASKIGCETCHGNHGSLQDDISAPLMADGPVKAIVDASFSFDVDGASNLCMNCHQSRSNGTSYDKETTAKSYTRKFTGADIARYNTSPAAGPAGSFSMNATNDTLTVVFDVPTTHVYLSSTRAYPHYGPMANVLHGIDGYVDGTVETHAHKALGCVECHMGESGDAVGGHTFFPNVDNCTSCHSSATDFNVGGLQTEVEADLALIEAELVALGALYIDDEGHPANLYASLTREQFQAYWNYQIMAHDVSLGVHNPDYYEAMIAVAKTNLGL